MSCVARRPPGRAGQLLSTSCLPTQIRALAPGAGLDPTEQDHVAGLINCTRLSSSGHSGQENPAACGVSVLASIPPTVTAQDLSSGQTRRTRGGDLYWPPMETFLATFHMATDMSSRVVSWHTRARLVQGRVGTGFGGVPWKYQRPGPQGKRWCQQHRRLFRGRHLMVCPTPGRRSPPRGALLLPVPGGGSRRAGHGG